MNIAHILPYSATFPLTFPNGRYNWVRELAQLQVQQGHTVTIYCNPSSRIEGLSFRGIAQDLGDKHQNNLATFRLAFENHHDVYHSHFDDLHYEVAHETVKPIVYTQHWWPSDRSVTFANTHSPANVWAVPPTRYMYDFDIANNIQSKGFIYHSIDLSIFHADESVKNNRLLFVGRIDPGKNLEVAIQAAQQSGLGLDIIGKITPKNQEYWDTIKQNVDGQQIQYLGTKTQHELVPYYTAAKALICPFAVSEAFGLVSIEAQACGTPVLMRKGGSRGELLKEGVTGFLCESDEAFTDVLAKLDILKSQDCINFAQQFSVNAMATAYEALYAELIKNYSS